MSLLRQAARAHYLYVLALPCVIGCLLVYGVYDHLRMHNYREAVTVSGIAAIFFAPVAMAVNAEVSQRRLLAWFEKNVDGIASGQAKYRGAPIGPETQVVVFHMAFSVVVASFRIPSQPLVVGYHRIWLYRLIYSAATFVFGWWAIPWGPIYTVQSLHTNLKTAHRGRLLDMAAAEGWAAGGGSYAAILPKP